MSGSIYVIYTQPNNCLNNEANTLSKATVHLLANTKIFEQLCNHLTNELSNAYLSNQFANFLKH
jgi:hypothetical protein